MARSLYGYTPADFGTAEDATNSDALVTSAVTLAIYDEPGGAQQSDLLDKDGVAVTEVASAAGALIIFQGPDGHDKDLYGTPDAGTTWYRFPPSPNLLVDRVATLEDGATPAALDDLSDVATAGVSDGDVLTYDSDTTSWGPAASSGTGLPSGGTADQFLVKQSSTAGDADWETHYTVPAGGADEALLAKSAATDGATEWIAGDTYWRLWSGSQSEYDALGTYDAATLYAITA